MRCDLCWTEFASPVALLLHEAQEDDRLYFIDGLFPEEADGPVDRGRLGALASPEFPERRDNP